VVRKGIGKATVMIWYPVVGGKRFFFGPGMPTTTNPFG